MERSLRIAAALVLVEIGRARGACVPIGNGTGCIPPDKATAKCEAKFADESAKLVGKIIECHIAWAARPNVADEEACEQAAQDTFGAHTTKLLSKGGCPACLDGATTAIGNAVEAFVDATNGGVFCDGTLPFGDGDDTGFRPPPVFAFTCERHLALSARGITNAIDHCQSRAAAAGVLGHDVDEPACELTAFTRFVAANVEFLDEHSHCPPCVGTSSIAQEIAGFLNAIQSGPYCAPTS